MFFKSLSANHLPYLLMICFFFFISWIAFGWSDIDILKSKSLDEYVFHTILLNINESFHDNNLRQLFSFFFYLYGFPFFFLNYLIAFPFIDSGSNLSVFLPRIISAISMFMTWHFLHKLLSLNKTALSIKYLILFLYILMPGIWLNATWFHPDFLMTWMMMVSIYFLFISKFNFDNHFLLAVLFWSLAISIKFQALMLAPIFGWFFLHNIFTAIPKLEIIKQFLKMVSIIFICYLFLNPYLIHPDGMMAWVDSFIFEFGQKSTINFNYLNKLQNTFLLFYTSKLIFIFVLILSIYLVLRDIFRLSFTFEGSISFCYLTNLNLLVLFSNKLWHHYYLPLSLFLLILLGLQLKQVCNFINTSKLKYYLILFLLLISQIFANGNQLLLHVKARISDDIVKYDNTNSSYLISKDKELENLILLQNILGTEIQKNSKIISSAYINLPLKRMGLSQSNNLLIYGDINNTHFKELEKSSSNTNFIIVYVDSELLTIANEDNNFKISFKDKAFESNIKKYFIFKNIFYHKNLVILQLERKAII